MKSTKVQTLGELRMRGTAKLMGWAICSMRLLVSPASSSRRYGKRSVTKLNGTFKTRKRTLETHTYV